jgi:hypothetical protein
MGKRYRQRSDAWAIRFAVYQNNLELPVVPQDSHPDPSGAKAQPESA